MNCVSVMTSNLNHSDKRLIQIGNCVLYYTLYTVYMLMVRSVLFVQLPRLFTWTRFVLPLQNPVNSTTALDTQMMNQNGPVLTHLSVKPVNEQAINEAATGNLSDPSTSGYQRAQSFFVSIESGKVGCQTPFKLRSRSVRSTSLVRKGETNLKTTVTDDATQVTSSTESPQTTADTETSVRQLTCKPNATDGEGSLRDYSTSDKYPRLEQEVSVSQVQYI